MKKNLFIFSFTLCALFATLESCKKTEAVNAANSPKTEAFYDGDEYDQGLVVEEPEEVEEPIDDTDYQSDATIKVSSFVTSRPQDADPSQWYDGNCTSYKYIDYYQVAEQFGDYEVEFTDSVDLSSIATNKPLMMTVQDLSKIGAKSYAFSLKCDSTMKARSIQFIFTTTTGKTIKKSIKMVNRLRYEYTEGVYDGSFFGMAHYSAVVERKKIGKSTRIGSMQFPITGQDITSGYTPQLGDVLFFNHATKIAVITTSPVFTAAKGAKPAAWKFKFVEMNSRCNGRRYTKSFKMTDPTAILSTDGTTLATKYFRD